MACKTRTDWIISVEGSGYTSNINGYQFKMRGSCRAFGKGYLDQTVLYNGQ